MVSVETPYAAIFVIAYTTVVGTIIDFDHLIIARLNTGDWELLDNILRNIVENPKVVLTSPSAIIEGSMADYMRHEQRLLSHLILSGVFISVLLMIDLFLATVSILILYIHVIIDLLADNFAFVPGETRN